MLTCAPNEYIVDVVQNPKFESHFVF